MSYLDNIAAANDSTFQDTVQASMIKYALTIAAEDSTLADHANRIALAVKIVANPVSWTPQFALACSVQMGAVLSAIRPLTDAQVDAAIDASVAAVWSAFSG